MQKGLSGDCLSMFLVGLWPLIVAKAISLHLNCILRALCVCVCVGIKALLEFKALNL